jgi:hypothetical protein
VGRRIDHKFTSNGDQVFGRLKYFRDSFVPVTPLPDGSGVTTGTPGWQDATAWAFGSNYQDSFSANVLNEGASAILVEHLDGPPRSSRHWAGAALTIPGILANARFPIRCRPFSHQCLPAARFAPHTASNFNMSVSEVVDSLTWLKISVWCNGRSRSRAPL